jgi:hypothetical protein
MDQRAAKDCDQIRAECARGRRGNLLWAIALAAPICLTLGGSAWRQAETNALQDERIEAQRQQIELLRSELRAELGEMKTDIKILLRKADGK